MCICSRLLFISEILVIIAPYHTVIKTAHGIGTAAVQTLKILTRGYYVYLPRAELLPSLAHISVKGFDLVCRHKSLPVRRIANHRSPSVVRFDGQSVTAKHLYIFFHSRTFHICICDFNTFGGNIRRLQNCNHV